MHSPGAQFRYLNGFPLLHCQPLSKSRLFSPIQKDELSILVNPERKWRKEKINKYIERERDFVVTK